jgi:hypothetical protein
MRTQAFWKKICVLCLTFWLGIFAANLFVQKKSQPRVVIFEKTSCVPVDGSFKNRFLSDEEKNLSEPEERTKSIEKSDKQSFRPDRDGRQYRNLLYKEHCYESAEQK